MQQFGERDVRGWGDRDGVRLQLSYLRVFGVRESQTPSVRERAEKRSFLWVGASREFGIRDDARCDCFPVACVRFLLEFDGLRAVGGRENRGNRSIQRVPEMDERRRETRFSVRDKRRRLRLFGLRRHSGSALRGQAGDLGSICVPKLLIVVERMVQG